MANSLTADLTELQDGLRRVMLAWHFHRTGVQKLDDAQAFEDLLVAANLALAEIRLDVLGAELESHALVRELRAELGKSTELLRETLALFENMLATPMRPQPLPSNVLVFTGSYRPHADNDAPLPGGAP